MAFDRTHEKLSKTKQNKTKKHNTKKKERNSIQKIAEARVQRVWVRRDNEYSYKRTYMEIMFNEK